MPQHDYVIDNQTGIEFRADLNNVLNAIVTNNSGAVAPTTTYPGMEWLDTSNSSWVLKRRNSTDSAWEAILTQQGISLTSATTSEDQRTALGLGTSAVRNASNSSGDIPLSNATKNENLNADMLDGFHSSSFVRTISGISPDVNGNVVVDMSSKFNTTGGIISGNTVITAGLKAYWPSAPNTGAIFLGSTDSHYLYFDGTNYIMPSGNLVVNGAEVSLNGHTHNYLPTDFGASGFPVGCTVICISPFYYVDPGSTTSATNLRYHSHSDGSFQFSPGSGTWRNIGSNTATSLITSLFQRIA